MKKYLFTIIIFLFGCELIVDIDVPFEHQSLTLNSVFTIDSIWTATVTLNRHILDDNNFQTVDNALVIIYDENAPIDTLIGMGDGVYKSDNGKPVVGKQYTIKASAENFKTITSTSLIPPAVPILSVTSEESLNPNEPGKTYTIKFNDEPNVDNYYQIFLETKREYPRVDPATSNLTLQGSIVRIQIESADPTLENENLYLGDGILLKDFLFDGKMVEFSFKDINGYTSFSNNVTIKLRSLSGDYYNYLTTSQLQRHTSGDPFAQPVNVYNNIENGFGIFAGYSEFVVAQYDPAPVITEFSPGEAKPGDHIIITGENFLTEPEHYSAVYFNSEPYQVSSHPINITDTQLEVVVPARAISGKIIVRINERFAISDADLEIIH